MYYTINESTAKQGYEQNHLMGDYKEGDTTRGYQAQVDEFAAAVAEAKSKTDSDDIRARFEKVERRW